MNLRKKYFVWLLGVCILVAFLMVSQLTFEEDIDTGIYIIFSNKNEIRNTKNLLKIQFFLGLPLFPSFPPPLPLSMCQLFITLNKNLAKER